MNNLINKIHLGDCLDILKQLPDKCVDLVLTDPPYGITPLKWDSEVSFSVLWKELKRIRKYNCAIVLFAQEPFASKLRISNIDEYKYDWIWEKSKATGHLMCKKQPLRAHEKICVFYAHQPTYIPQTNKGTPYKGRNNLDNYKKNKNDWCFIKQGQRNDNNGMRYPRTVLKFKSVNSKNQHPTQKPVELLEYIIKTYTKEGALVLDFASGSGSLAVACVNTQRRFICIEKDHDYWKASIKRLEDEQRQLILF